MNHYRVLVVAVAALLVASLAGAGGVAAQDSQEMTAEEAADYIEQVSEDLQDELLNKIVWEINNQSQDIVGEDIAYPVDTPEEARQLADEIEEDWGQVQQAEQAYEGLRQAADQIETNAPQAEQLAEDLRSSDDPASIIEDVNAHIEDINQRIESEANAQFENVEHIEPIDTITLATDDGSSDTSDDSDDSDDSADSDDGDDDSDDGDDGLGSPLLIVGTVGALLAVAFAARRHGN